MLLRSCQSSRGQKRMSKVSEGVASSDICILGGDVAQLVEHQTGMLLRQV